MPGDDQPTSRIVFDPDLLDPTPNPPVGGAFWLTLVAIGLLVGLILWASTGSQRHHPPPPSTTTTSTSAAAHEVADAELLERARPLAPSRGRALGLEAPPPATTTTIALAQPATTITAPPAIPERAEAPAHVDDAAYLGRFVVTCYGPPDFPAGQGTASGEPVGAGSIAADPRVVAMGAVLRLDGVDLATDDGTGHVNDTGGAVHGHHLDVWLEDCTTRHWPNPTVDVWRVG